jgi:hypothetical protein
MSSKVLKITIDSIPHIINMNHVYKVVLKDTYIKIYYTISTGNLGGAFAGSGFIHSGMEKDSINMHSKENAERIFEEIAKLM